MITGLLIISIITFIAVLSYKRPRLEQKVFKNIPVVDWLNILGFPPIVYIGLTFIVVNILSRDRVQILDFEDFTLITVGIFFLVLAFVGQSIHFVSKVISRYLPEDRHSLEYQVNEMFHGKLSHYLVIVNSLLVTFILGLLEINHPFFSTQTVGKSLLIVLAGIIFGFSTGKSVIYSSGWYGGYFRPIFSLVFILTLATLTLIKVNNLKFSYYPLNLFTVSAFITVMAIFLVRQFFIFSRLNKKRRLQFIARFLSI